MSFFGTVTLAKNILLGGRFVCDDANANRTCPLMCSIMGAK